jgi:BASS family bile acid:Na+ symporter
MLTETETRLLGVMMALIMLGMGASLTFRDFLIAFRKPKGVLVGLLCQYGIMPFLGYALAMGLGVPPALAAGLILMGCMPGGTTSNIFTYFSKGALALSIMMTSVSTLVAVVVVPLLIKFYSGLAGIQGEFVIPAANVAQVLVVLLVPTVIGMVLRKATTPWPVYCAAIGLGLVGMLLGFVLARLLRQDANRSRTIALETGIQNGPLAVLIVTLTFSGELQQQVLLIPVLYSLFIVLSSTAVTLWFRRLADREALARDRAKVGALVTAAAG